MGRGDAAPRAPLRGRAPNGPASRHSDHMAASFGRGVCREGGQGCRGALSGRGLCRRGASSISSSGAASQGQAVSPH